MHTSATIRTTQASTIRFRRHAMARAASATLAAGLLGMAPGAFAVTYNWSNGDFVPGTTAPSPLAPADVLNINAGSTKSFNGVGFTNGGTVNWTADPLYLAGGAVVVNNNLWNVAGDFSLNYNGGAGPSFTNNGSFRKTAGSGSTTINAGTGFVNNGTLEAQVGSLAFTGGSTFNAGSVFTGAGSVVMSSGTNVFNGSFTSSNLVLASGVHSGSNAVANGAVTLSGGTVSGTWQLSSGQAMTAVDGGNKIFEGGGTLFSNQGSFAWNTANPLYLQGGAIFRNTGLVTVNQTTSFQYNGGSTTAWQNNAGGTLRAATGTTLTVASLGFANNAGTLDAQAGASIRYSGGSVFNSGTTFGGAGSNVAAGNNTFNGSFNSINLVLESGTHSGGNAVITGNTAWTGGDIQGSWQLAAGHTLRGETGGNKILNSGAFTNNGTLAWNTTNFLYLQSSASFVNQALFVANASTTIAYNGGSTTVFDNTASGTLRAAAGQVLTLGNILGFVNNGGVLDAQAGASIVHVNSRFNAGTAFTGSGSNVASGSNSFFGSFNSANLVLQSGLHSGTGAVVNGTSTRWTGGTMSGTWQVAAAQTLSGNAGGSKIIEGGGTVLTNNGTLDWATGNPLLLQGGAKLTNQGLFVASVNTSAAYNGGSGTVFDNTAGGIVRAAAGVTLNLNGGLGFVNNGGTLNALAGASIVHGSSQFNAGTQFTGAGSNVAAGNNGFAGSFTSANLVLDSGSHTGAAAVLNGSVDYAGGLLQGTWTVAAGQTLRGVAGGAKIVEGGGTVLTNAGTVAWTTGNPLLLQGGATFNNAGTLNFNTDSGVLYNGGSGPTFANSGLIVKTGGAGTTAIGDTLAFSNTGTVDVQSGTIALPTNFGNAGTLRGSGSYAVNGTLGNAGRVAPGAGLSVGTLGLSGNYAQTAAGTFAVDLQSLALHDLFNISGTAALNGTLAIGCFGACSLAVGDSFTILDSVGDLSGTFASVTLSGFATGAFNVVYDTVADRVQLVVTQTVTAAVPEPGSYALLLAGLCAGGFMARRRAGARHS